MKPYGGPGFQQVIESQSFYWDAQWWADQGYIVVTTDGRGTTGRGPQWDRAIYETMKSVTLEDQIDAVRAAAGSIGSAGWRECGSQRSATRSQPRRHDRLVVRRIPLRARRVGGAGNVRRGLRGRASDRLDAVRHALHRTLSRLDSAVYERNSIIADAPQP